MKKIPEKKKRASWILRVSVSIFDVALWFFVSASIGSFLGIGTNETIIFATASYFIGTWAFERANEGRSVGKLMMGYIVVTKDGEIPSQKRILSRAVMRGILLPLSLLSWRRVTLLDLISGVRVIDKNAMEKTKDKRDLIGFNEAGLKR